MYKGYICFAGIQDWKYMVNEKVKKNLSCLVEVFKGDRLKNDALMRI